MRSKAQSGYAIRFPYGVRIALTILTVIAVCRGTVWAGQSKKALPTATEGMLCYESPVTGEYEYVPLKHTDVTLDVRGLVRGLDRLLF